MEGSTMGQILHGSATTTEAIRRAIQHSQESLRALAQRYGVSPKTVAKWKAAFGGPEVSKARRLRALEEENAKLKRLRADSILDASALRELLIKCMVRPLHAGVVIVPMIPVCINVSG